MRIDHPMADVAIGALIALIVLLVTPGVAVAAIVAIIVFLAIGVWAVVRRRAWANSRRRAAAVRAHRRLR